VLLPSLFCYNQQQTKACQNIFALTRLLPAQMLYTGLTINHNLNTKALLPFYSLPFYLFTSSLLESRSLFSKIILRTFCVTCLYTTNKNLLFVYQLNCGWYVGSNCDKVSSRMEMHFSSNKPKTLLPNVIHPRVSFVTCIFQVRKFTNPYFCAVFSSLSEL